MIIYTTAQVINLSGHRPLRTVWAVDINAYPEASSIVKQTPSGMRIESTEYTGDQNNLREIDPVQFINVGVDGRLSGERKDLKPNGVEVKIPRTNVPQYEHLKLENTDIKWYKETGGQWAFHDATAQDIERFIQKYLTNAEFITKQRIFNIGEENASKINSMQDAEFMALLSLPKDLPAKYNENFVIKKNGQNFMFANQNDVAQVEDNQITAFRVLQTNINLPTSRVKTGVITEVASPRLTQGLYKVNYEGQTPQKLTEGNYTVTANGVVTSTPEFTHGGVYIEKKNTNEWYNFGHPDQIRYDRADGILYARAGWGGKETPFLYTTHPAHRFASQGRYDTQVNPDLHSMLKLGGVFEVEVLPALGNSSSPWDYHIWDEIYRIRRVHPEVLRKDAVYTKDHDGYITMPIGITDPGMVFTNIDGDIVPYNSVKQVKVVNGIPHPVPSGDSLVHGRYYEYDGIKIVPAELPDPATISNGYASPFSLCSMGLEQDRIYQFKINMSDMLARSMDGVPCSLIPYTSGGCIDILNGWQSDVQCFSDPSDSGGDGGSMIPEGVYLISNDGVIDIVNQSTPITVDNGIPSPYVCPSLLDTLDENKIYKKKGTQLIPYDSEGPVNVETGIPMVYVCGRDDVDVALPENVYIMVNGDDVTKVNREDPVTVHDGVPHPFACPPTSTKNSGGHLLAAALMGAGVKEIISNSMIYEEHADDETELEA